MVEGCVQRRLAAILAADVVGYSRLMEADEEATLRTLKRCREIIDRLIADHEGRVFGTAGDSVMAEFRSAVEAVRAATAIQEALGAHNIDFPDEGKMMFRIGVNLGDIIVEGTNLYGDGVNVAARIEGLCAPGEVYVSDSVHGQVEGKLSLGFEDKGAQTVKNIAKPVRVYQVRRTTKDYVARSATVGSLPLPDKPSIAVLPFENMSGDPEQEYFSDGITEDIITELSKISGLFVIARHSSFVYKQEPVSVRQVGRELGVRYVLDGSVRKAGNRLRITAQLVDSVSEHHLWADRYDRDLEDIFTIQDEVARKVTDALEVALTHGESKRLAQPPTENLETYDLYLRARRATWPPSRHNIHSAVTDYERVIEFDPNFAGGYAGKSMLHSMSTWLGYSADREADIATAFELARHAVALDPDLAQSHSALGFAYAASGQHDEAIAAARRAVELQPGDADSHAFYGRCLRQAGFGDEACAEARTAMRLDPQYVEGPYLFQLGRAAFLAERYEESMQAFERNFARGGPTYIGTLVVWAAACSLAGNHERAHELVQDAQREHPGLSLANIEDVRGGLSKSELARLREGLRMAGLPN
jgi:adenylate cyclase